MPTPMKPRTKNNSPDAPNTPFRGSLAQRACEFDQTPGCCCLAGLKLHFIFFRIFSKRSSAPEKSRLVAAFIYFSSVRCMEADPSTGMEDRKSVGKGKSGSVCVNLGGCR